MENSGGNARGRAPPFRAYPFYIHLAVLFSLLIIATGGLIAWLSFTQGRDLTLAATNDAFAYIGRETHSRLRESIEPVSRFTDLLALQRITRARDTAARLDTLPYLRYAFDQSTVTAVYVGYADGGFFLLRPLNEAWMHSAFAAPAQARYLVQSIEKSGDVAQYIYFDTDLRELSRRPAPEYKLDPVTRPWYRLAREAQGKVFTDPYVFYSTGRPGMTLAKPASEYAVVGVDMTLGHLSTQLAALRTLPGMRVALFDEKRRLLASSDDARALTRREGDTVVLNTLDETGDALLAALPSGSDDPEEMEIDAMGKTWKTLVSPIDTVRGPLHLAIAVPLDELLQDLRALRIRNMLLSLALLLVAVPLTVLTAHGVARALRRITAQAQAIRAFDFDGPPAGRSVILEVDQLAQAMETMRETIRNFLEVATSLGGESNLDRLLTRVVQETCKGIGAMGGLVYLPDVEELQLRPAALVDCFGRNLEIEAATLPARDGSAVAKAFSEGTTQVIAASAEESAEFSALRGMWPEPAACVVAIPVRERGGDCVGVLLLFLRAEPSRARLAFAEALSGTAAVTIEAQHALELRRALLEAFIRLIASAIDAKSPYTGGHCQRVPELTFMLARAACEARTGPFENFDLNEQEWEALYIAGWLHDCGKVTTPEYVVDKATKLETIYDRLNEIRMRFEVLKRDAQIDCLRKTAAGGDAAALEAECRARHTDLDEEFAFVATCNLGGEFMDPGSIARLEKIAQRKWERTLDDRIGVSRSESDRKAKTSAPTLPATENLLADKPEHLVERSPKEELPPDNKWGFKMPAPEYKFNLGEMHNLRTARGTLSPEERYIINHHIVQTIAMLSQLPFPKHLRSVPEIAGGHHEKMDGTGYPKRLKREEMSLTARMMAIADIFEALTASDRPYKKAKTLSESLKIMQTMKAERHVDPELYELFIDAEIWRSYAERFLQPEQIDLTDASAYR